MSDYRELFARHLELAPLGGKPRGKVRCRFHQDRTASLSVDLIKGVFHCFGCGVGGGPLKFAELVGEASTSVPTAARRSPLDEARAEALRNALSQPWAHELVRTTYFVSDYIRASRQLAAVHRAAARAAVNEQDAWELLARAAELELGAAAVETDLDLVLTGGPLL